MSRAGTVAVGAGSLDDVAIYGAPLSAATITGHYEAATPNKAPTASFTASPNPASTNATVTFNAAASKDVDGTIAKYEWDLDGNGSYETDTTTPAPPPPTRPRANGRSACGSPTTAAPPAPRPRP